MRNARRARVLSFVISAMLILQCAMPMAAYAEEHKVQLSNHNATSTHSNTVSNIVVDGVDAPRAGTELDQTATVSTAEGATWDIPVLWVRDDLQLANGIAQEGRTYLPALAFFVPQEYSLEGASVTVTLADSLAKLFGTTNIVSVYNAERGITYILPASLVELFASKGSSKGLAAREEATAGTNQESQNQDASASAPASQDSTETTSEETPDQRSLIDIYCAPSAREAFTDEDLEWIINLIINYLEPQAVELLLDSFPSLGEAASNGLIGTQIGLYIYYKDGENDVREHRVSADALAYVSAGATMVDGQIKYCYMLAVNLDDLAKQDEDEEPVADPTTGKLTLLRAGTPLETLENTIVHELFHAIMDDYNRTGMAGATDLNDVLFNDNDEFPSPAAEQRFVALRYPRWFIEGSASAVENVYQFRYEQFQLLRRLQGADFLYGTGDLNDRFTSQLILDNYLYASNSDMKRVYFDLEMSNIFADDNGDELNTDPARYVSGYLATLYPCALAVQHEDANDTAITTSADGSAFVDSEKLRRGLDSILRWLHNGDTLDEIIHNVSPVAQDNTPLYTDTDDYAKKFIKGTVDTTSPNIDFDKIDRIISGQDDLSSLNMGDIGNEMDKADKESLTFVTTFLNYLLDLDNALPEDTRPNGSILFDFDKDFTTPLDATLESSSDTLKIVESNKHVESSVSSDTAQIGGGKSDPNRVDEQADDEQQASAAGNDQSADEADDEQLTGEAAKANLGTQPQTTNVPEAGTASEAPQTTGVPGTSSASDEVASETQGLATAA